MRGPEVGPSDPDDGVGLAGASTADSVDAAVNMFANIESVTDSVCSRARRRGTAALAAAALLTGAVVGMSGTDDMPAAPAGTGAEARGGAGRDAEDDEGAVLVGVGRGLEGDLPRLTGALPAAGVAATGAGADTGSFITKSGSCGGKCFSCRSHTIARCPI